MEKKEEAKVVEVKKEVTGADALRELEEEEQPREIIIRWSEPAEKLSIER